LEFFYFLNTPNLALSSVNFWASKTASYFTYFLEIRVLTIL